MTPLLKSLSGEISAPVAMVARGSVAAMPAVVARVMAVMAVEGVAAKCAYTAADESAGQRVAVEGGGEACTGHSSYRSGGEHAMFTRAAGGERKSEEAYQAERDDAAHGGLLFGVPAIPPCRGGGREADIFAERFRLRFSGGPVRSRPGRPSGGESRRRLRGNSHLPGRGLVGF